MDKVKEAINKMKKEYKKRITELLTEEYEFDEVSVDTVSALSNAHSLEAGVHTLNTLERILNDREYASKKWGLEATKIESPVKLLWSYTIGVDGGICFEKNNIKFLIPPKVINRMFADLGARGFINDQPYPLIVDYMVNDDAEIVVNTTLGIFHIPPHLFEDMVEKAITEGYLSYSINLHRFNSGGYDESLEFKMKPKTEEEEED